MKRFGLTLAVLTTLTLGATAQQAPVAGQRNNSRNVPNGQNDGRTPPTRQMASPAEQILESLRRMRENDPAKTVIPMLIKRNDVRGELGLDPKQREALESAKKKDVTDKEAKVANNEFFIEIQKKLAEISKLPIGEQENARRAALEDLKFHGQKLAESLRGEQENTANMYEKILRPEQLERLRQLDWQWRGPLALSDPKMNDIFQLSEQQQQVIGQLVQEYREQQRQIIGKAMGQESKAAAFGTQNGNASDIQVIGGGGEKENGGGTVQLKDGAVGRKVPQASETELRNRYDVAKREVDALRKKYGEMALKLLSQEQRQYWFQSLGRTFAFRAND